MGGNSYIQAICGTENMVDGSKFLLIPFTVLLIIYVIAALKQGKKWPLYRCLFFSFCFLCVGISSIGPLAIRSQVDFKAHMINHLLLGMVAPLLLVLAAPMTLILRTLPVFFARKISMVLKSFPLRFLTHPIVAGVLNIRGLWLLYTTNFYAHMHEHSLIHFLVHFHIFMAGYIFTLSIIPIDPLPHRFSILYRAIVLIFALAGHGILAKHIYAHPPIGVPVEQGQLGGMIMYYGGDIIDSVMIYLLCQKWFGSNRVTIGRRERRQKALLQ
jgi:putative membrane protein